DRRVFRLWGQDTIKDASGVSAVFGTVGSIDFGVNVVAGVDEGDVLLNTAGPYPTLVPLLGPTEPMSIAPSNGSEVQVVAVPDDPHRHRFSQRAVAPDGRDLQFFRFSALVG